MGIDVAGVEFIVDKDNKAYVYDINTNTNYNSKAEQKVGVNAMRTLAAYLGNELSLVKENRPVKWAQSA